MTPGPALTTAADLYTRTDDLPYGSVYPAAMAKRELVGVQKARDSLASRITPDEGQELVHTVIAKRGTPVAVIVPIDWYREAAKRMKDPTEY